MSGTKIERVTVTVTAVGKGKGKVLGRSSELQHNRDPYLSLAASLPKAVRVYEYAGWYFWVYVLVHKAVLPQAGPQRSGVDPPLSSSRACLPTAFIAFSIHCVSHWTFEFPQVCVGGSTATAKSMVQNNAQKCGSTGLPCLD